MLLHTKANVAPTTAVQIRLGDGRLPAVFEQTRFAADKRDCPRAERDCSQDKRDCPQAERDCSQAERDCPQAERDCSQAERDCPQAERDCPQAERDCPQVERDCSQVERDCSANGLSLHHPTGQAIASAKPTAARPTTPPCARRPCLIWTRVGTDTLVCARGYSRDATTAAAAITCPINSSDDIPCRMPNCRRTGSSLGRLLMGTYELPRMMRMRVSSSA
jgi:hypothetical protein